MRIGYACLAVGVPATALRTCTLKNATEATLQELTASNLAALGHMLEYNCRQDIRLFRISSDIVPFASHPLVEFAWDAVFHSELAALGKRARECGMRLSMHPGQYTVINSPDSGVVARAVADLAYHCRFLDLLGMGPECKIILHVGGAYGDKPAAMRRFAENYARLDPAIRRRLVIENDDKIYTIGEVLQLGLECGIPVVFDNLHHAVNPDERGGDEREWIAACAPTWGDADGPQKLHYSQQAQGKRPGSHSRTVRAADFRQFLATLSRDVDIMLEVKDKNLSAVKCALCNRPDGEIRLLEQEWARYKYAVLERSPSAYQAIRMLLKDKSAYPAQEFYRLVEQAMEQAPETGTAVNAAAHVWGYFKRQATESEKRRFASLQQRYVSGTGSLTALKRHLLRLAEKYGEAYLLQSLYFVDC